MTQLKMFIYTLIIFTAFPINIAIAADKTVTARGLAFQPLVVNIEPGDTVHWENMMTHNVEMLEGLIPKGTEAFKSRMSKDFSHTFETEGVYIYQCTPHIGAGMGGAVIVGQPKNLEVIKGQDVSGGIGRIVDKAIEAAEAM